MRVRPRAFGPGEEETMEDGKLRVTRRDVLRGAAATALIGAVASGQGEEKPAPPGTRRIGPGATGLVFRLNGKDMMVRVEPRVTLLDLLRDHVGLTGTKRACDHGACGSCTVHLDGKPVNACLTLAWDVMGREVVTIEGLAKRDTLHPVQRAFVEQDGVMCGFCTPGMVMSCAALLDRVKTPTDEQIRDAVSGNLCRCGTYPHVFAAVKEAAK